MDLFFLASLAMVVLLPLGMIWLINLANCFGFWISITSTPSFRKFASSTSLADHSSNDWTTCNIHQILGGDFAFATNAFFNA